MKNLNVVEIFSSLQGEGGRAGEASIFIRLAGCNKNCWYCDTDFITGAKERTVESIHQYISLFNPIKWIVWTGGEPLLQLDEEIINYFHDLGYKQAIETNGTLPIPRGLDYVVVSPKVPSHLLEDNLFPKKDWCGMMVKDKINEFRFIVPINNWSDEIDLPNIDSLPKADYYYLSPMFVGKEKDKIQEIALNKTIEYIMKTEPRWRLSVQQHKIWKIK